MIRFTKGFWKRTVSMAVLFFFLSTFAAPFVYAQDGSDGSTYQPDPQEFTSNVTASVALQKDLETRWAQAAANAKQMREQLAQMQQQGPPDGTDPAAWQQQLDYMQRQILANDENITNYRQQLGNVYGQIDQYKQQLYSIQDPQIRQDLGTLLGVGGMAAIPVYNRPNISNLGGSLKNAWNVHQLNGVTNKIAADQAKSAELGQKLQTAEPPQKQAWSVSEENGRVVLKNADGTVKDMGSATTDSGDGTQIKNNDAFRKADYYNQLYGAKANIENQIDTLKFNRSKAATAEQQQAVDKQINDLESKKTELQKDLDKYNSENPSSGSQLKELGMGAAKWAAFSVGITVATNAITQLAHNGWDPSRIDWGQAIAPLKTAEFWGGTAGSFGVSMLASALIPGGAFIKTFAAIGGAALGWQLGTGNLGQTDWGNLLATTMGATIGSLIGGAIGGPIGAFLGGIVGNYAASWILDKVRDWLETPATALDRGGLGGPYHSASDPPGYNPSAYNAPQPPPNFQSNDPSQLKAMMDQAYMQMMQYSQDPSKRAQFAQSQQQFMALKSQLEQMQRSAQPGQ